MCDRNDSPNNHHYKSTPPTNRKVRNPFDKALIDRLHKPICSPGMCKVYKQRSSGSFRWEIDQACTLVPADIVACNSQFEPSPDPALEKIAEDATEKFFSQELVIPSPLESSKKVLALQTSADSPQIPSFSTDSVMMKNVSAQTILTLPPELPPEVEKILQAFCTFTQEQNISGDYEITANGSLRRKLFFEGHSDAEHYDSEQTDDEIHMEPRPPSSYDTHKPVVYSPDVNQVMAKGVKRTFGTPSDRGASSKPCFRNKILDVVDFAEPCLSPIGFQTPNRDQISGTSSNSLASISLSPVTKAITSSDEEKNNLTSPESEAMATCLDCIVSEPESEKKRPCFCKKTPNKSILKRSASLKETPPKSRRSSLVFSEKRSLSMSSLNRSRSVQKLDFSMDMSVDGSFHDHCQADSESSSPKEAKDNSPEPSWSLVEEAVKNKTHKSHEQTNIDHKVLNDTPIKGKCKSIILTHEISKIREPRTLSPLHMSLDNSFDGSDNPLSLEDKKIDFNDVDLKFLTENLTNSEYTANTTKAGGDCSTNFKRVDSGFNENTFYTNASSYYESAIKPSELTVTNISKLNTSKTALKEISNVPWMRVDSGFKDENSADSDLYPNDSSTKKPTSYRFSEARLEDKENYFDGFLRQSSGKNEAMSMSDVFTEDMTFGCPFSSTPSKNKSRNVNS